MKVGDFCSEVVFASRLIVNRFRYSVSFIAVNWCRPFPMPRFFWPWETMARGGTSPSRNPSTILSVSMQVHISLRLFSFSKFHLIHILKFNLENSMIYNFSPLKKSMSLIRQILPVPHLCGWLEVTGHHNWFKEYPRHHREDSKKVFQYLHPVSTSVSPLLWLLILGFIFVIPSPECIFFCH